MDNTANSSIYIRFCFFFLVTATGAPTSPQSFVYEWKHDQESPHITVLLRLALRIGMCLIADARGCETSCKLQLRVSHVHHIVPTKRACYISATNDGMVFVVVARFFDHFIGIAICGLTGCELM